MKYKKILAIICSFSMIGCLTACGDEDSSSKKESKEIQTETVAVENSDSLNDNVSDSEDDSLADEGSVNDEELSSAVDDSLSEVQKINDIMNEYDSENPEDTIVTVLEEGFKTSFNDNIKIVYDDKDKNYEITVWQDGFSDALETEQGVKALDTLSTSLESVLDTMLTQIRVLDDDANLKFNFVSEKDNSKILLTIYNGEMTYCITQE